MIMRPPPGRRHCLVCRPRCSEGFIGSSMIPMILMLLSRRMLMVMQRWWYKQWQWRWWWRFDCRHWLRFDQQGSLGFLASGRKFKKGSLRLEKGTQGLRSWWRTGPRGRRSSTTRTRWPASWLPTFTNLPISRQARQQHQLPHCQEARPLQVIWSLAKKHFSYLLVETQHLSEWWGPHHEVKWVRGVWSSKCFLKSVCGLQCSKMFMKAKMVLKHVYEGINASQKCAWRLRCSKMCMET